MQSYIRKVLTQIALICITILAFTLNSKSQQVNFSGSWKLNLEKSDFGNVSSRAAAQFYYVEQHKQEISLKWTIKNESNEKVTSSLKLLLEGDNVPVLLPSGRTRSTSISFSADGKILMLNKTYSKANQPRETDYMLKEKWQFINEGKDLLIELTSPSYVIKAVYEHPGLSTEMKE